MQTILYSDLPKKCFIHENKRYLLKGVIPPELPFVNSKYENILKANNIPYRKISDYFNEEVCEYWNPEFSLHETVISLPLFAKVRGGYVYCNKEPSIPIPSSETIEAAKKTQKFVRQEINNYELILTQVHQYQIVKLVLDGSIANFNFGFPGRSIFDYPNEINLDMNKDNFKVLFIPRTQWFAIFDMNRIAPNGYITLEVPKDQVGLAIGRNGSNIKYWAEKIGVKKINVIPI